MGSLLNRTSIIKAKWLSNSNNYITMKGVAIPLVLWVFLMPVMIENWLCIRDFDSYDVSDLGRVRSWINCRGNRVQEPHVLTPGVHDTGYLFVNLRKDGRTHKRFVHRLVLEAFVGPCPTGMECRHFPDPTRTNASLANLSWGSSAQNQADKISHGTQIHGSKHYRAILDEDSVKAIRQEVAAGTQQKVLAKRYGVSRPVVSDICRRKSWRHC